MRNILLKSGYSIPALGLGTWLVTGRECFNVVLTALEYGYTHIDTAAVYDNEHDIGQAIQESGINRSTLFITTKVWYQKLRYKDVLEQVNVSLDKLRTSYLDLLLIHWPNKFVPLHETFEAFERLVAERKIRSIGVSNFTIHHLEDALKATKLPISNNQVEMHPLFYQQDLIEFCKAKEIVLTAYSPLAHGKIFNSELLKEIAAKKDSHPAQVAIAWLLQKGIVVIPKATSEEHLKTNIDSLSIHLTEHESIQIDNFTIQKRTTNPKWSEFDY
jgi:diketogulonate reductase-like aldo/keto reductase